MKNHKNTISRYLDHDPGVGTFFSLAPQQIQCPDCSRTFSSVVALRRHRASAHNVRCPIQLRVADNVCPACHKVFTHRYICINHGRKGKCRQRIIDNCPELDSTVITDAIRADNKLIRANAHAGLGRYYAFS